ncbi:MAG: tetratricopeptide repeat protein [Nitrospirae bacterium]|nr:tetratricopeptide repeat protein [Nitrospirota bacterium]
MKHLLMAPIVFALAVLWQAVAWAGDGSGGVLYALRDDVKSSAVKALNSGDYDAGVAILEKATSDDRFDTEAKELLAFAYRSRGWAGVSREDFEAAYSDFRMAKLVETEKDANTYLGLGYSAFRLRKYDDALYYLDEAGYLDPDDGRGHQLKGEIYYQRGRLDDAVREWEDALKALPDDEGLRARLAKAKKELGVEGGFTNRQSFSFNIKYEGEEKRELGDEVMRILEEASSNVGGDLGYYPRESVTVILYTRQQFNDVTQAPDWSGGIYDGTVRIPVGGTHINRDALALVLHHEYTHAVVHMMAGSGVPTWLNEGIAQYEERWVREQESDLGYNKPVPLSSLNGSFLGMDGGDQVGLAYAQSLSVVEFYISRYGMYSLSELLGGLGEGKGIEDAFQDVTGSSLASFEYSWRVNLGR